MDTKARSNERRAGNGRLGTRQMWPREQSRNVPWNQQIRELRAPIADCLGTELGR